MQLLQARQQAQTGDGSKTDPTKIIIILVVVISFLAGVILLAIWFFNRRAKRLRRAHGLTKGEAWRESVMASASPPRHSTLLQQRNSTYSLGSHRQLEDLEDRAGVERHSSVRSVVTLPSYSLTARPDEGVMGREGERAGIDTVLSYPETSQEEEDRREEEMESLYQIRHARRQELEQRIDRRRRRREARERGDMAALLAIEEESRLAHLQRDRHGSNALIDEHESRPRLRRVSAVSYGSLGVARHDGSRVRVSGESERPLLDGPDGPMSGPLRPWMSRTTTTSQRPGSEVMTMHSYDTDNDSVWSDYGSDAEYQGASRTRPRADYSSHVFPRARSLPRPVTTIGLPGQPQTRRDPSLRHRRSLHSDVTVQQRGYGHEPPPYSNASLSLHERRVLAPAMRLDLAQSAARPDTAISTNTIGTPSTPKFSRTQSIPNFSMRRDSWMTTPPGA